MSDTPLDPHLMLQAALDGELDAAGQAAFERQLAEDPALAAAYERHRALHHALQTKLRREPAPAGLRDKITALGAPPAIQPRPARRDFMRMAAALVIGLGLGGGGTYLALLQRTPGLVDTLVASHRRALLAGTPVDIASNDRHNVRPWFDARIAISPPTPDLSAQGFPLIGGRIDVVNGAPAPSIVYRAGAHVVSVTALPDATSTAIATADAGFHVVAWRHSGFTFWMVSDADRQELGRFAEAFKTAVADDAGAPAR